jgi:tRNA modification GTPase
MQPSGPITERVDLQDVRSMLSRRDDADRGSPQPSIPSQEHANDGPFFTVLSAPGRGAIAVIRVWGKGAIEAVAVGFRANAAVPLLESEPGRLLIGRMGAGLGDEVVAVVLKTEVPAVELQCHGGTAAVEMVLESLERAGARRGRAWEIPRFDYPGGDRLSAEAIQDLAHAQTVLTAEILLDQVHGALGNEIAHVAMLAEQDAAVACVRLDALIERGTVGLHLLSGWKVVIAGRPNVGKSRLLNALCGFSRAIVDGTPGTTRDVVAFRTALLGWPVEFADTAGLRETNHAIERLGIERAQREVRDADLVLLVLDRSESLQPIDRQLIATIRNALLVANKADHQPAWTDGDSGLGTAPVATVSAERGDGMDALVASLIERMVPAAPLPGEAVPFRARHLKILARARDDLRAGNLARGADELGRLIYGEGN